jgi:hypothetical protein
MKPRLPWHLIGPNDGFFVPGVDIEGITRLGLRSALHYRVKVKAVPGIKDGLLGVWFSPARPESWIAPAAQGVSQSDESRPVVHVSRPAVGQKR